MFSNLDTMGRPLRLAGTDAGRAVIVPPIKVRDIKGVHAIRESQIPVRAVSIE